MSFNKVSVRAVMLALVVAMVAACGGGGGGSVADETPPAPPALPNVLPVTVDAGPANTGYNVNRLYANVTICSPGSTSRCQTIDHVLIDTGSTGLRLLSGAMAPELGLSRLTADSGLPLLNCAQFVDNSHVWGPVTTADVVLGGMTATNVPIQVIGEPAFQSTGTACSADSIAYTTAAALGANGILGIGVFKEDCGPWCIDHPANGFYFTCTDATCTATVGTTASLAQQVKNPVPLFATNNNGILVDLPAVSPDGAISLNGAVIFGIGTLSNNQFTTGAVVETGSSGNITTVLAGKTMSNSFIDTGSNGLFFDSATLPLCTSAAIGFYCPPSTVTLAATIAGANGVAIPVSFAVGNVLSMLTTPPKSVLPALAGPFGYSDVFDWGLPFFYGRRVFIGIEGLPSPLGTGPLYAF
jgi:hypothetical protein